MPRELELELRKFRAFRSTGFRRIRPLTILVGENSTGKTSFLAALRFAMDLDDQAGSYFNRYPFDLGAFEDIAHVGRDGTRSHEFSISIKKTIDARSDGSISLGDRGDPDIVDAELRVTFTERFGDVVVGGFQLEYEDIRLIYSARNGQAFSVYQNGELIERQGGDQEGLFKEISTRRLLDLRQLSYFAFDRFFSVVRGNERQGRKPTDPLRRMVRVLDAVVSHGFNIQCSPPVRSVPRRVYTSSDDSRNLEGSQAPFDLNRAKRTDKRQWTRLSSFLNRYGKLAGLFTRFDIAKLTKQDTGPFQLKVTVRNRPSNIVDVGYGVSQALPIITDLIQAASPNAAFLFQQPEVHLHPKAQAALGTIFAEFISSHPDSMIVAETHSDYLIDRVRIEVREGNLHPDLVSILYFSSSEDDIEIHDIGIDREGNVVGAPTHYRDFFIREQERVLGF